MALNFFKIARGLFMTPQPTTPTSPNDGDFYFDQTLQKFQFRESALWKGLGSSSSGINYITNPDADTGITGWASYKDAAQTTPVDGTGGSPSHITIAASSSTPLRGTNSFLMANSGGSSAQGEGLSYAFTIDRADLAQVLSISFDYEIISGTFSAVNGTTPSDMTVWIYDVTNGTIIPVTPSSLAGTGSGNTFKYQGVFQTSSNSTSYRLIMHVGSTNTSAWTMKFDNVSVGPQTKMFGAIITPWQSYTPTYTGVSGSSTTNEAKWRRVGDCMELKVSVTVLSPTSNAFTVTLPPGFTIKNEASGQSTILLNGNATTTYNGGVLAGVFPIADNGNLGRIGFGLNNNFDGLSFRNADFFLLNGSLFTFNASFRVNGWGSAVQMSDDANIRVVAASAYYSSGLTKTIDTAETEILVDEKEFDTHTAFDITTGRFTAPVSGYYQVSYNFTALTSGSLPGEVDVWFYINGTGNRIAEQQIVPTSTGQAFTMCLSAIVSLKAGDYISAWGETSVNSVAAFGGVGHQLNQISFQKLSGPATIAATEIVAASIHRNANNQPNINPNASDVQLTFNRVDPTNGGTTGYDTHNGLNGNAFYTVPASGLYRISGVANFLGTNSLANAYYFILRAGPATSYIGNPVVGYGPITQPRVAGATFGVSIVKTLKLRAGDRIYWGLYGSGDNTAAQLTMSGAVDETWVTLERISGPAA